MVQVRENRLLLGNPGTGKSTLVNCLVGESVFKSGIAWGGGLTQEYQKHVVGDIAYMDTPGLADPTIMEQAAIAIKTALTQSGKYKLFFMVRLQAGRVVSDDLVTIERVLDAIDIADIPFSILVNNLSKRQYETMVRFGPEYDKVFALINQGKHKTPFICFIPKFDQLHEADNKVIRLPDDVIDFLERRAPIVTIPATRVSAINTEGLAEEALELKNELELLRENHEQLQRMLERLQARFREELERERDYRRLQVDYYRQLQHSSAPALEGKSKEKDVRRSKCRCSVM